MGAVSVWHMIIVLVMLASNLPAYWAIRKTGWSGWWFLLLYLGPLGLIFLWVLAFAKWPGERADAQFDRS